MFQPSLIEYTIFKHLSSCLLVTRCLQRASDTFHWTLKCCIRVRNFRKSLKFQSSLKASLCDCCECISSGSFYFRACQTQIWNCTRICKCALELISFVKEVCLREERTLTFRHTEIMYLTLTNLRSNERTNESGSNVKPKISSWIKARCSYFGRRS